MRILVTDGEHNIRIPIPTGLLCNPLTARIGAEAIRKYAPSELHSLSPEKLTALFAEVHRIRRIRGPWVLVDVQSADGKSVKITI